MGNRWETLCGKWNYCIVYYAPYHMHVLTCHMHMSMHMHYFAHLVTRCSQISSTQACERDFFAAELPCTTAALFLLGGVESLAMWRAMGGLGSLVTRPQCSCCWLHKLLWNWDEMFSSSDELACCTDELCCIPLGDDILATPLTAGTCSSTGVWHQG